jgi:diaminopimelate epimerase
MAIPFMKMSGAGNDFVVIDNRDGQVDATPEFISKVCARRLSVGADGLLLVERPQDASSAFRMRYYNSDGSEAETCGNGARCISRFAHLHGIATDNMSFETAAGPYTADIVGDGVKLGMSSPTDVRAEFTVALTAGNLSAASANTGVPHVVYFVDDVDALDVVALGRETRYHEDFAPAGTNANFAQTLEGGSLRIRTYERGVEDETLACGTGAVAAAITAARRGKATSPTIVRVQGGFDLLIHYTNDENGIHDIYLEGDARVVCAGELREEAWDY